MMMKSYHDDDPTRMMKGLSSTSRQLHVVRHQKKQSHVSSPPPVNLSWPSYPSTGILNVLNTSVNEALDTILSAADVTDNDDGTLESDEAGPAAYSRSTTSSRTTTTNRTDISSLVIDPIPINPLGIQKITKKEVPLSATWQDLIKDPNTDLIQWVFTTPPRTQPQEDHEDVKNYEPLDAEANTTDETSPDTTTSARVSSSSSSSSSFTNKQQNQRETWDYRFQELLHYRDMFGNCLVPHNWKGGPSLSQWVKRQRYQYKLWCKKQHSTLNQERITILNKVGFVWSSHHAIWEDKFNELKEFLNQHGHCNVPSRYPENKQLGIWVRSQRRQYKLLCQQQQKHLPRSISTTTGRTIHPQEEEEDDSIACGDHRRKSQQQQQQQQHGSCYMSKERIEKLQSLGFEFDRSTTSRSSRI